VRGPDGKAGIWSIDESKFQAIPALPANYAILSWTEDGGSVYVAPRKLDAKSLVVSRVDILTGKTVPWKTFGEQTGAGVSAVVPPHLSADGNAYAYLYVRVLSEA
jgi:hypothetical protein